MTNVISREIEKYLRSCFRLGVACMVQMQIMSKYEPFVTVLLFSSSCSISLTANLCVQFNDIGIKFQLTIAEKRIST